MGCVHLCVIGGIEGALLLAVFIIIIIVLITDIRRKKQLKKTPFKVAHNNANSDRTHDADSYCTININKTKTGTTTEPSQIKKKLTWLNRKHLKTTDGATKDDESTRAKKPEGQGAESVGATMDPGLDLEYKNLSTSDGEKMKVYHILEPDANAPPENDIVIVQEKIRRGPTDKEGETRHVYHILESDPKAPQEQDIVIVQEQHVRANDHSDVEGDSKTVYHIIEADPDAPQEKDIVFVSIRDKGGRNVKQNTTAHVAESGSWEKSLHVYSEVHDNCSFVGDQQTGEMKLQPVLSQNRSDEYQDIDLNDNPDTTTSATLSSPTKKKSKWTIWKRGNAAESSTKQDKERRTKKPKKAKAGSPSQGQAHTSCLPRSATHVLSGSREATSVGQDNENRSAFATVEETKNVYHILERDANAPQDPDIVIVPIQHLLDPSGRNRTAHPHEDVPCDSSSLHLYSMDKDSLVASAEDQNSPLPTANVQSVRGAAGARESGVLLYTNVEARTTTSDQKTAQWGTSAQDETADQYEVVEFTRDRKLSAK